MHLYVSLEKASFTVSSSAEAIFTKQKKLFINSLTTFVYKMDLYDVLCANIFLIFLERTSILQCKWALCLE